MSKIILRTKLPRAKSRVVWGFNPIARVVPSKKIYSRKRLKIDY